MGWGGGGILIKKLGGQCDIRYGYFAYVNDCHMTEKGLLQSFDFIQNMLSSKRVRDLRSHI